MCGIAGIFASEVDAGQNSKGACLRMLEALEHRGPDAGNVYADAHGTLALGHRRLAIIDLSEAANQPIPNETETVWLSFNGEIYNFRPLREELIKKGHRFRSKTDSEVIVHLYEEYDTGCLEFLRGMFAFALWDSQKERLFLARDRFGIKPLYYAEAPSAFIFASETNALLASGFTAAVPDRTAIVQFLQYGSVPSPLTVFEGIRSLPPGHYLLKDRSGLSLRPYWTLADCFLGRTVSTVLPVEPREILSEVVRDHMTSDVPLAILLSGGMDSSSLVALAREVNDGDVNTLTIGFSDDECDESGLAREVSARFGTRHYERFLSAKDFESSLDSFVHALDQPTVDGFNTYLVSQAAKEGGFRVLLSGLGGDEVFGGYPHFKTAGLFSLGVSTLSLLPGPARRLVLSGLKQGVRLKGALGADRLDYLLDPSWASAYRVYRGVFSPGLIQNLMGCSPEEIRAAAASGLERLPSALNRMLYLEFSRYLHDQLLRDTDMMSMHHSVEMRVPFLDHELVSKILSLPAGKRFHPHRHKVLLRRAMNGVLPDPILNRPKRGFIFPLGRWMRTSIKPHVEEVLFDSSRGSDTLYLNHRCIVKIWAQFLAGKIHWSLPWSLYVLKRWGVETKKLCAASSKDSLHK